MDPFARTLNRLELLIIQPEIYIYIYIYIYICTEKAPCGSGYTGLQERIQFSPLCLFFIVTSFLFCI